MGERDHDRQLREARLRYLGAVKRLHQAATADGFAGIQLDPGPDPQQPHPWTQAHWQALIQFGQAHQDLIDARREWDALRRERHGVH